MPDERRQERYFDTHADEESGMRSTKLLYEAVIENDPDCNAYATFGFNFLEGEPTPYQTKNSYFGQVDTAGFPKDTYYIYRAEWTDYKTDPMVHIFPYWDFNEDQIIDVRAASNAPVIELFFNGISQGKFNIDHKHGKELLGHWRIPYAKDRIDAVAYDENGEDMAFVEVNVLDADGNYVANDNNRVRVEVSGAARLV